MKRIFVICLVALLTMSCSTLQKGSVSTQRQSYMIQDHTELKRNKKYYHQKRYNPKKIQRQRKKLKRRK